MVDNAVIIYDQNDLFKKILERIRTDLKRLGARKVRISKK
jgi:hypothetical protein